MKLTSKLIELKHTRYAVCKALKDNKPAWIGSDTGWTALWAARNIAGSLQVKTPQGWMFVPKFLNLYSYD